MPTIRINQFADGATGHVNVTYIDSGVTYGANVDPASGAQDESARTAARIAENPSAYSYQDIQLSEQAYANSLAFAQSAVADAQPYAVFCNNCVDFADNSLVAAGFSSFSISGFLTDDTLLDNYARLASYICLTDPNALMYSLQGAYPNDTAALDAVFAAAYGRQPDFGFTGDLLDMYNALRDALGPASTDAYIDKLHQEWLDNGGSPIVLDLNGDGIRTTSLTQSNVFFDVTGDGQVERTAWLSKDDAFLVRDINGNGVIDGVNEMFGGTERGVGYAELSALDSNGDMQITATDADFASLRLWRDADGDGVTQSDEMYSLEEFGIDSLRTDYLTSYGVNQGNMIGETSVASGAGGLRAMGDVYFQYENTFTEQRSAGVNQSAATLIEAMSMFAAGASAASAEVLPQFSKTTGLEYSLTSPS